MVGVLAVSGLVLLFSFIWAPFCVNCNIVHVYQKPSLSYFFVEYTVVFIIIWKVAGEFVRPKNIMVGSNSPSGVRNAAFYLSPSLT